MGNRWLYGSSELCNVDRGNEGQIELRSIEWICQERSEYFNIVHFS
jgi:hypothetical protein